MLQTEHHVNLALHGIYHISSGNNDIEVHMQCRVCNDTAYPYLRDLTMTSRYHKYLVKGSMPTCSFATDG